jgi:hypothetical protein
MDRKITVWKYQEVYASCYKLFRIKICQNFSTDI